jgi:hypothetical protein
MDDILKIDEKSLLPSIHRVLSESGSVFRTVSGKKLQVLSAGRINVHEGPDFLDMALLIEGKFIIGDGEFHKKLQFWKSHKHGQDLRYSNVILHIAPQPQRSLIEYCNFETLLIEEDKLFRKSGINEKLTTTDFNTILDLQEFALNRINRKSDEIRIKLNELGAEEAFKFVISSFLKRFQFRRRRPVYDSLSLENILQNIVMSNYINIIKDIYENIFSNNYHLITSLLNEKIAGEGKQLQQEIFINCLLPIALCLAKNKIKTDLMIIFWSLPALNKYGILKRRFGYIPQDYVWQQQGMLEYMKEFGNIDN